MWRACDTPAHPVGCYTNDSKGSRTRRYPCLTRCASDSAPSLAENPGDEGNMKIQASLRRTAALAALAAASAAAAHAQQASTVQTTTAPATQTSQDLSNLSAEQAAQVKAIVAQMLAEQKPVGRPTPASSSRARPYGRHIMVGRFAAHHGRGPHLQDQRPRHVRCVQHLDR